MASPMNGNENPTAIPYILVPVMHQPPMEFEMQAMGQMELPQQPASFYMVDPMVYYHQTTIVEPFQILEDPSIYDSDYEDNDLLIPKAAPIKLVEAPRTISNFCKYVRSAFLISILVAYVAILLVLPHIPGDWLSWKQASCMPDHCFCEEPRPNLLRQPVNTWTNIAFTIYGVYILMKVWALQLPQTSGVAPFYAIVYAWALVFIGITSGWFHASLTFLGQWFDVMGMFLLVNWCFAYNFSRLGVWRDWGFLAAYLSLDVVAGTAQYLWPETRRWIFSGMIIVYLISTFLVNLKIKPVIQQKWIWLAILSFAVAFTFWILDLKHILCFPTSVFQGHGVWHVLTATSAYLVFKYYTTEQHPSSSASTSFV